MKVTVVEVEMNEWKTTYTINLNSDSGLIWEDGRKEYEITDYILELLKIKKYSVGLKALTDMVNQ